MALDNIYGKWVDSFQLLYTFKAEVEKASPGSVVTIDKHTVQYKLNGKSRQKECFRRVFVSFKACWQGFLNGCRPYLAVDATALMADLEENSLVHVLWMLATGSSQLHMEF